jgi:hypothetical protein
MEKVRRERRMVRLGNIVARVAGKLTARYDEIQERDSCAAPVEEKAGGDIRRGGLPNGGRGNLGETNRFPVCVG